MALKVWATRNTLDTTGTGTTDFTHGTVTNTPVAALHCFTGAEVDATPKHHARMAFGMTDGTDERYASCYSQNGVAPSNTGYNRGTAACISSCFTTGNPLDGAMSHNSFIAGGQRLNNDNAFGDAVLCNSLFFDCDNAKVMSATLSTDVDVEVTIDPGFAWDCVIFIGCPKTTTSGDDAEIYIGFFDRTNQGCIMFNTADGDATPGDPSLRISDTYVGGEMVLGTGTLDYGILASLGSGNELDLTPKNAGGDGDPVYCLFLGWSSTESVSVVSWDSPTGTGSNQVTTVGFQPQSCIHLLSFAVNYDQSEDDADGGGWGVSFETADDQFCASISDEVSTGGNSDTQSIMDDASILVEEDDGTDGYIASLTNYLSNGWDHNFTATQGAANRFISLVFETDETGTAAPLMGVSNSGGF